MFIMVNLRKKLSGYKTPKNKMSNKKVQKQNTQINEHPR